MPQSRAAVPLLLAAPALALALAGLAHPHHLTWATSQRWYLLHLPGLLVFPLVGAALAVLVRGRRDPVAWAVRATAYLYATFYTALDVVSGIGAGYVTHQLGPGVPRSGAVTEMFRIGTPLGEIGSWALLACGLLLVADQLARHGRTALVGVALVPGAWLVHVGHIFAPVGVAGMVLLAVGTAGLAAWPRRRAEKSDGAEATIRRAGAS